jgi:hypothetical protein
MPMAVIMVMVMVMVRVMCVWVCHIASVTQLRLK